MPDSSKYVVEFFLAPRYFQGGQKLSRSSSSMRKSTCLNVLTCSFGFDLNWRQIMDENPYGFYIRCTTHQFTVFIMNRYIADEVNNGLKDLRPEYVNANEGGFIADLAKAANTSNEVVRTLAGILKIDLQNCYGYQRAIPRSSIKAAVLDVSEGCSFPAVETQSYLRGEPQVW